LACCDLATRSPDWAKELGAQETVVAKIAPSTNKRREPFRKGLVIAV